MNGIHTYSNNAIEKMLGWKPEEIIGKHVSVIWPKKYRVPANIDKFNRELKDGESWSTHRVKFDDKDGRTRIMESTGNPIYDDSGILIGYRGVDRDVTDQVRQERHLKESENKHRILADKLTRSNDHKTLLLDIITHDLKNPASVILGFSEFLLEDFPNDERIATVETSARTLINVLDRAATLASITSGDEINMTNIDLDFLQKT